MLFLIKCMCVLLVFGYMHGGCLMWVPGTKLRSSVRKLHILIKSHLSSLEKEL